MASGLGYGSKIMCGESVILHPSMLFISFFAVIMRCNLVVCVFAYLFPV